MRPSEEEPGALRGKAGSDQREETVRRLRVKGALRKAGQAAERLDGESRQEEASIIKGGAEAG